MKMIHPTIDAMADTTIESYNAVWAPRGWVLLGAAETFASEVLGKQVTDCTKDLKVEELRTLHAARGLEYPHKGLKDDLLKGYLAMFADQVPVDGAGEPVEPVGPATPEEAAQAFGGDAAPVGSGEPQTTSVDATPVSDTTAKKK